MESTTKTFHPALYAIQSVCGSHTFTEESVPELVVAVGKLLSMTDNALPERVITSLVRHCTHKGKLLRFRPEALFEPLRPEPADYGITQLTELPMLYNIEFTQEEQKSWSDKVLELKKVPQYAQRSKEWYEQRHGAVTASDFATAVGESKYDKPEDLLLKKCGRGIPFTGNQFTRHGQRFEDVAVRLYQKMYHTEVFEFGLMPHGCIPSHSKSTVKVVAASPDGISDIGIMLEIKCPFTRKIIHYHPSVQGDTDGDKVIVPHGYYCQIQQQLECCDLEVCDFMECNIKEFDSSSAFYSDVSDDCAYKTSEGYVKSCVLEFRKIDTEEIELHIEYPPDIYYTGRKLQTWIQKTIKKVQTDKLKFQRPIYYKVVDISVFRVYRDREFFYKRLPVV
jgi:putative phage-type endonuclease